MKPRKNIYSHCCEDSFDNAGTVTLIENTDIVPEVGFYIHSVGHDGVTRVRVRHCPFCGKRLTIKR